MVDRVADDRRLTTEPQVRYRVATIGPAPDARWELHDAEFADKALAEESAHYILWFGSGPRPRNAHLVRVVEGVVEVPDLLKGRMQSDVDGDPTAVGRESEEEGGAQR